MFYHAVKTNFTVLISSRYQPFQTREEKWREVCHFLQTIILFWIALLSAKMPEICLLFGGVVRLEHLPVSVITTLEWKVNGSPLVSTYREQGHHREGWLSSQINPRPDCLELLCIISYDINLDNSTIYWRFTTIFRVNFRIPFAYSPL